MSLHESSSSEREPTRELLLAQALDACIEAERHLTGSSEEVIGRRRSTLPRARRSSPMTSAWPRASG